MDMVATNPKDLCGKLRLICWKFVIYSDHNCFECLLMFIIGFSFSFFWLFSLLFSSLLQVVTFRVTSHVVSMFEILVRLDCTMMLPIAVLGFNYVSLQVSNTNEDIKYHEYHIRFGDIPFDIDPTISSLIWPIFLIY